MFSNYSSKPLVFSAEQAHREHLVRYLEDGTVELRHPMLAELALPEPLTIPPSRQFPAIRATFDDLNKALSRLANSPKVGQTATLRESYEQELSRYEELVMQSHALGAWEPDYGNYVFDHHGERLYLVAPEPWHRLALVTSNSTLNQDPENRLSWQEVRAKLEGAVLGFAGVSVGGNLLEGWLREARPRRVKLADPDWVELTNLNRCERGSLRHLVRSRAERFDRRNPYENPRVSKAEYVAYEQNLVDPYLELFVYQEPLSRKNYERFLLGDGLGEPPIDILVEEVDHLDTKIELRQLARRHRIDVLMVTDFGHRTQVLWNPFAEQPDATLGATAEDDRLLASLAETKSGERSKVFDFIRQLCRFEYEGDPFECFVKGVGEHPTGSLPQSGSTTMIAGGIGGKELALRVLGHRRATRTQGFVFDFLGRRMWES